QAVPRTRHGCISSGVRGDVNSRASMKYLVSLKSQFDQAIPLHFGKGQHRVRLFQEFNLIGLDIVSCYLVSTGFSELVTGGAYQMDGAPEALTHAKIHEMGVGQRPDVDDVRLLRRKHFR